MTTLTAVPATGADASVIPAMETGLSPLVVQAVAEALAARRPRTAAPVDISLCDYLKYEEEDFA